MDTDLAGPIRVLIVEDRETDAELIRRELQRGERSFEFEVVTDRAAFESALDGLSADIVLCDYNLPDIDAIEIIEVMKVRYGLVPVVIVTGSISEEVAVECIKMGAVDYVIKQHLTRLPAAVDYALDHARLLRSEAEHRQEIEKARDSLVTLLDAFPNPVRRTNAAGDADYFNNAWCDFTGRARELELGEGWKDGLHPDDRERCLAEWAACLAGRVSFSTEYRMRHSDGTWHRVADRGEPIFEEDGTFAGFVDSLYDLEAIRRAEERERLLATAIDAADEAIVITDSDGRIEYVNPAFERLTQFTLEEVEGDRPSVLRSGRHNDSFYSELWRTIKAGRTWRGVFVNRKKDGSIFEEKASISPVLDEKGDIQSFVAVKRDISRERELEATLQQSQKLDAIGRLAGGVAHDLNNLLAVITGHSDLLTATLGAEHPAQNRIDQIRKATRSAADLTKQLLAFSRRQVLQPTNVDLNQLIEEVVELLNRVIPEHIRVRLDLQSSSPIVHVDRSQMEQVLVNLAINARDAMPQGGELRFVTSTVDHTAHDDRGPLSGQSWAVFEVIDNGIGMSADQVQRVFEPFYSTKGPEKGMGLGLSTVYGIVSQSGGEIEVDSEPGLGTRIIVHLPLSAAAEPDRVRDASKHAEGRRVDAGQRCSVLLVEDQDMLREMIQEGLEVAGFDVIAAPNGIEAVELAGKAGPIDLLLTDVVMPGMSGSEVAKRLTKDRPSLAVLFMSGYTGDVVLATGVIDKEFDLLTKPFTIDELVSRINHVLQLEDGSNGE